MESFPRNIGFNAEPSKAKPPDQIAPLSRRIGRRLFSFLVRADGPQPEDDIMIRKLFATTSFIAALSATALQADTFPEVEDLTLGFIKLTDMAPLAVAYELSLIHI